MTCERNPIVCFRYEVVQLSSIKLRQNLGPISPKYLRQSFANDENKKARMKLLFTSRHHTKHTDALYLEMYYFICGNYLLYT